MTEVISFERRCLVSNCITSLYSKDTNLVEFDPKSVMSGKVYYLLYLILTKLQTIGLETLAIPMLVTFRPFWYRTGRGADCDDAILNAVARRKWPEQHQILRAIKVWKILKKGTWCENYVFQI